MIFTRGGRESGMVSVSLRRCLMVAFTVAATAGGISRVEAGQPCNCSADREVIDLTVALEPVPDPGPSAYRGYDGHDRREHRAIQQASYEQSWRDSDDRWEADHRRWDDEDRWNDDHRRWQEEDRSNDDDQLSDYDSRDDRWNDSYRHDYRRDVEDRWNNDRWNSDRWNGDRYTSNRWNDRHWDDNRRFREDRWADNRSSDTRWDSSRWSYDRHDYDDSRRDRWNDSYRDDYRWDDRRQYPARTAWNSRDNYSYASWENTVEAPVPYPIDLEAPRPTRRWDNDYSRRDYYQRTAYRDTCYDRGRCYTRPYCYRHPWDCDDASFETPSAALVWQTMGGTCRY